MRLFCLEDCRRKPPLRRDIISPSRLDIWEDIVQEVL